MLIHEVCRCTNLTKKAVEYYTQKGLVIPELLENGYRDYKKGDLEVLRQIGVLRRLGMGMEEIREILTDHTGGALKKAAARKELRTRQSAKKDILLRKLEEGTPYWEVEEELQVLEMEETIAERLLDAFPGYYGRFVWMHFSGFLSEPVKTTEQQEAYEAVTGFLDEMPSFEVPEDVEEVMSRELDSLETEKIEEIVKGMRQSLADPEAFLAENQETIAWYLAYRQSKEYQDSAAGRWMECMRAFQSASGYTTVFLPAMRRLSPSYQKYCDQMERANEQLLKQYPEAENL